MSDITPTRQALAGVIEYNRGLLARARDLNCRAGAVIFPIMDRGSLATWLANRLQGARRASEVQNPDVLKLPELDQAQVARVLTECPDTICVLGFDLPVEYRGGSAPLVRIGRDKVGDHTWRNLPDEGVKLPGGRLVEIMVIFTYYNSVSGTDVPALKRQCASIANKSAWDVWRDRPAIGLPDLADPSAVVPEIIEAVYGVSVVDGTPLMAYGVAALKGYRYSSDSWFEDKWYQSREEAQTARVAAIAKLDGLRKEISEKALVEAAKKEAEEAKEELRSVQSRDGWYELEYELRRKVEDRTGYWGSIPSDLEGIKARVVETRALKVQVEAALGTFCEHKAQAERERQAAAPKPAPQVKSRPIPQSAPAFSSGGFTLADLTQKWGRRS